MIGWDDLKVKVKVKVKVVGSPLVVPKKEMLVGLGSSYSMVAVASLHGAPMVSATVEVASETKLSEVHKGMVHTSR